MITNAARCTREIKSRIAMAKAVLTRNRTFHQQIRLKFKVELVKWYVCSIVLYGADAWTLRKVDQKYPASFEIWCRKGMEKISWTDHVRNEEVSYIVREEINVPRTVTRWKANWIGRVLHRNCVLKHAMKEK
jgi:hypothetical protein